ncbi:MAG: M2 family metallopeptidase [Chlamydiia bacterium]|nr:M2 family metallopeptidase [Chlamydiia bacterium]
MSLPKRHPFQEFLDGFIPEVSRKSKQLNQALWILETTGSQDAADLKADLDTELRLLFNDTELYRKLCVWEKEGHNLDPLLKRQLNVLIRAFKQNQIPQELLEKIAKKEAALSMSYSNFRLNYNGKVLTENDVREILKKEKDPQVRRAVWDVSKQIGIVLAPHILEVVNLRNQAARSLGYIDYFQMQLDLQEVKSAWLSQVLDDLAQQSDAAYGAVVREIEKVQSKEFSVPVAMLGPWAWSDPFCQEDPLDTHELDQLVQGIDIIQQCNAFYQTMGIDVTSIMSRSDLHERPGKSQHAFCINMDRASDVRTLNNVRNTIKWLETVLHELGHAVYELGFDAALPWLLREPPHMITTEAMALIAGRQAYRYDSLGQLVGTMQEKELLRNKAEVSLHRRQLIFSRWVLVMTAFEKELYHNPSQDLNILWWHLVEKYQKIHAPKGREGKADWAAKYHIGLAPVYYFSYLLGEMFASAIQEAVYRHTGCQKFATEKTGQFLQQALFSPGNRMSWSDLVEHVTGRPLNPEAWVKEFSQN